MAGILGVIASGKIASGGGGGDFDADLYGTVVAWYRAEDAAGADASSVAALADQSTNGSDLAQATGANQPTLRTNIVGGKSTLRFDGTNDSLAGVISGNVGTIIAVVGRLTDTVAGALGGSNSSARVMSWYPNVTTLHADATDFWSTGTTHRVNGVATTTFPAAPGFAVVSITGTPAILNAFTLGNSGVNGPLNGDVAEVVMYSTALSTGDQDAAAAALMAKYGL